MTQRTRQRCESTAMGTIVLDLRPGLGIGPFYLGMPIREAFAQIQKQPSIRELYWTQSCMFTIDSDVYSGCPYAKHFFSVFSATYVHYRLRQAPGLPQFCCIRELFILSVLLRILTQDPLKLDVVMNYPDHGFHLRFNPLTERVCLIGIFNVKRLQMRCSNTLIGGPSSLATSVALYVLLGPHMTYPGTFDKDIGIYTLFYQAIFFAFPIPCQYADYCQDGIVSGWYHPRYRPCLFYMLALLVKRLVRDTTWTRHLLLHYHIEVIQVKLGEELYFTIGGQHIPLGSSPRDVWIELGQPGGIHQKQGLFCFRGYYEGNLTKYTGGSTGYPLGLRSLTANNSF